MWLLFLLLLFGFTSTQALPFSANDVTLGLDSDTRVTFLALEPSVVLFPFPTSNDSWYKIQFTHLDETKNISAPGIDTLFGSNFTYSAPATVQNDSVNSIVGLNMSATLRHPSGRDLAVSLRFLLFAKESSVNTGSETIHIQRSSLKFSVEMSEWPFSSPENMLMFFVTISSSRSGSLQTTFRQSGQIRNVMVVGSSNDSLFIQFPQTGIVNSQNENVDIIVNSGASDLLDPNNRVSNDTIEIAFAFPHFKTLSYDPDIGIQYKTHNSPILPLPPSLWFLIVILGVGVAVAVFGVAVAIYAYYRNRQRRLYMNLY